MKARRGKPPQIVGRKSKKGRAPLTCAFWHDPTPIVGRICRERTPRLEGARWGRRRRGRGARWWSEHRRRRLDRWWRGGPMRYADELIPGRCCARPLRRAMAKHGNLGKVWRMKRAPLPQPSRSPHFGYRAAATGTADPYSLWTLL